MYVESKYKNTLPYARRSKDPVAYEAYRAEDRRLHDLFTNDLFEYLGITNNPKRFKLFEKAWSIGHSYGYHEVWGHAEDLVELIE